MNEIVFGPVHSRRFGKSLGIDLSPSHKQCNYDCVYCELEKKAPDSKMHTVVPLDKVLHEISQKYTPDIDVLTITANGEPTLYPHLKELIFEIKKRFASKTLILSNGSLFGSKEVKDALVLFDIVKFSFDGGENKSFRKVDRPHKALDLESIKRNILEFSKIYKGDLIAEVLLVKGLNDGIHNLNAIAEFINQVAPRRVDLNTIDRPPAYSVKALNADELLLAYEFLKNKIDCEISLPNRASSIKARAKVDEILQIIKRRPLELNEAKKMLLDSKSIDEIIKSDKVALKELNGLVFLTKP